MGNGGNTRANTAQTGHKGDVLAVKVRLEVEGDLREDTP